MYTQQFGLSQDPFSMAPDPHFLFMSERHREALAHLLYGVAEPQGAAGGSGGGFVLLTGDIGAGKTTICRCFLAQIPPGCHVAYIFNPKLTVPELLQSVCEEFHIHPSSGTAPTLKQHIDALNAFLLQAHSASERSVLIIDEAQNLSSEVLEQLRLLTNLETAERKLLQIVLIGQPELRTLLAQPQLEQLAQRVVARFHLDALNATETTHYIAHRLVVAGHTGALPFEPRALQRIHQLTGGVPRRINLLCGRALLGAWATGLSRVTVTVVNKAAAEAFGEASKNKHFLPVALMDIALGALVLIAIASAWWLGSNRALAPRVAANPAAISPAQATPATPPVSSPSALAAPADRAPATPPQRLTADQLQAQWSAWAQPPAQAWRDLAQLWPLPAAADSCEAVAQQGWSCHQAKGLTLQQVRELGRPGVLTLQTGSAAPVLAVLTGLTTEQASLRLNGQTVTLALIDLSLLWQGDFATLWQPPEGFDPQLKDGSRGPVIEQLAHQLDQLEGRQPAAEGSQAPVAVLDAALRRRVIAFQQVHGLKPDGWPGAWTLMQIERELGLSPQRLLASPPAAAKP
ncbi:AAA family ATPase [Rhodoferax sp.]|uniref:AAA family ATPase n=1 Tax=Rhodoferax sp. TaxID=50421 RepID=UPI002634E544|nr:AAA family ATPase [Rhodoferax sp.]MDD5479356.1 AAA family ATPase [Rhodoferax sp.]